MQHITLEIKGFFSIQGVAFIEIFLFEGIAFQKMFQVSFEKKKTCCAKKEKKIICFEENYHPHPTLDIKWSVP